MKWRRLERRKPLSTTAGAISSMPKVYQTNVRMSSKFRSNLIHQCVAFGLQAHPCGTLHRPSNSSPKRHAWPPTPTPSSPSTDDLGVAGTNGDGPVLGRVDDVPLRREGPGPQWP